MSGCRWVGVALLAVNFAWAQEVTLTARVELLNADKAEKSHESGNVLVWLVPLSGPVKLTPSQQTQKPRLDQRNKSFEPHVLVVPVGSVVAFPNHDPFFHNVFSLFEGKRFDLGLYEAGSTRDVHFSRTGISYTAGVPLAGGFRGLLPQPRVSGPPRTARRGQLCTDGRRGGAALARLCRRRSRMSIEARGPRHVARPADGIRLARPAGVDGLGELAVRVITVTA